MKYFLPALTLLFSSCNKNDIKLNTGWNELYHIEGNDTISKIYFPNSFSPDGDGINDLFHLHCEGLQLKGFEFKVIKKNGKTVFKISNWQSGWDGTYKSTKASNGIYYYTMRAVDVSGYQYEADGSLYLIR